MLKEIPNILILKDTLKDIEVDKECTKVFRLGAFDPNEIRPIKVTFNPEEDARYVLKKKDVKVSSI